MPKQWNFAYYELHNPISRWETSSSAMLMKNKSACSKPDTQHHDKAFFTVHLGNDTFSTRVFKLTRSPHWYVAAARKSTAWGGSTNSAK